MRMSLLFALIATSAITSAQADEIVKVPAKCGIRGFHAQLNRAENSRVAFYSHRTGQWIQDGSTPELYNHGQPSSRFDYAPKYPKLFAQSRRPYLIKIGGEFSVGRWIPWGQSKDHPAVETFPDHVIVHLYGGEHEDSNTDVTITYDHQCI